MPDYFVRRTLCVNGETYPQIWFDLKGHPSESVEHKARLKFIHRITDDDKQEFDKLNNSRPAGSDTYSFVSFLDKKYPEPKEERIITTTIETEIVYGGHS